MRRDEQLTPARPEPRIVGIRLNCRLELRIRAAHVAKPPRGLGTDPRIVTVDAQRRIAIASWQHVAAERQRIAFL